MLITYIQEEEAAAGSLRAKLSIRDYGSLSALAERMITSAKHIQHYASEGEKDKTDQLMLL